MSAPLTAVTVPARYERYLREVLASALVEIGKDQREPGSSNELPDFAVFEGRTGSVMVLLLDVEATPVVSVRDVLAEVARQVA